jgi:hypothetical protein
MASQEQLIGGVQSLALQRQLSILASARASAMTMVTPLCAAIDARRAVRGRTSLRHKRLSIDASLLQPRVQ